MNVPSMISLLRWNFPDRKPQKTEETAVTKILTAEMIPNLSTPTFKSCAIYWNSGGNNPIMILSNAASAINTNIVKIIFALVFFKNMKPPIIYKQF